MSKGSNRRPAQVTRDEWERHWAETFCVSRGTRSVVPMDGFLWAEYLASHSHSEGLDSTLPPGQVNTSVNRSED